MTEVGSLAPDAPREAQRVARMKLQFNKFHDRLAKETDPTRKQNIQAKMEEIVKELHIMELEAEAKLLRQRKIDVNVKVPLAKFSVKSTPVSK